MEGQIEVDELKTVLPYFLKHKNVWTDFDKEADVLYIHFRKPNHADNSEMIDDDIIIRYQENEVIGISILNASKKKMGN